jgi:hypothetical protein
LLEHSAEMTERRIGGDGEQLGVRVGIEGLLLRFDDRYAAATDTGARRSPRKQGTDF